MANPQSLLDEANAAVDQKKKQKERLTKATAKRIVGIVKEMTCGPSEGLNVLAICASAIISEAVTGDAHKDAMADVFAEVLRDYLKEMRK